MDEPNADSEILIDYHFGTLPAEAAARVEERLLADEGLLRAYLQLKRQLDSSTNRGGPSPEAQARLRLAVAEAYGPGPLRSLRRWLRRPMPRYQTLAVAAAVAVVVAMFGMDPGALAPPRPHPSAYRGVAPGGGGPVVDSARALPASREVF